MVEKKFTDFIRQLFNANDVVTIQDIYGQVLDNYPGYLTSAKDYQHRVRSALYYLKKSGEIISVGKGAYKKVLEV